MHFVKTNGITLAVEKLVGSIRAAQVQKKPVVWLVSGGSAISVAVETQKRLASTDGMTVMQIDERFGPVGHGDSNWKQLVDAGFDDSSTLCRPVLCGEDVAKTTADYAQLLRGTITENTYVLGLFGIGADGHMAGILPNSPAAAAREQVVFYQGPDYPRITVGPAFFARIDTAIVYAMGENKLAALQNLQHNLPIVTQPAQLLKQIPDTWIYNDQIGDDI